jgi:tetratricopeptide (TPR) repeat protein
MRRFLFGAALVCTLAAAVWHVRGVSGGTAAPGAASVVERYRLRWEHPTEQAWIVDRIVEAIAGFAGEHWPAAPHGRATVATRGNPDAPEFAVSLPAGDPVQVPIRDYIWSPDAYAPIAAVVIAAGSTVSEDPPAIASSLEALTHPLAAVIQQENLRISDVLRAHPRSADAHEEAALVLCALGLREAAGDFSDPRQIMSRMAAHLAVAGHLRASRSVAGRAAEACLLTLAGRERDALRIVQTLESDGSPGVRAWIRALRLRNTNDWRPTRGEAPLTLFEQLETLRAIQATLGSDRALDYVSALENLPRTMGWARTLLQGGGFSVEAGHRFANDAVDGEIEEIREIRDSFGASPDLATPAALAAALNASPQLSARDERDGTVRAIDWGTWAAAAQRHLLMQLHAAYRHEHDKLGRPAQARRIAADADAFSTLSAFPLLRPYLTDDRASHERAIAGVIELCRTRPDLVTFEVWEYLFQTPSFAPIDLSTLPPSGPWFTPLFPAGTTFDLGSRAFDNTILPPRPRLSLKDAERLRALAPSRRQLVMEVVRLKDGNFPPYGVMQREYGDLVAYDLILARRVARAAAEHPDAYVPLMRHVGELNPESLVELGAYLADRGRAPEAEAIYEEWVSTSRDRVEIANGVWWLVRRYHETGRTARAEALARQAAAVYSFRGLVTLADLHDWRGNVRAARAVYEEAANRYDTHDELLAFYLRRGEAAGVLQSHVDRTARRIFPKGLERASIADFIAAPSEGVTLVEVGDSGRHAGLRNHDILVAVDGIRVRTLDQYRAARGSGAAPELRLIVWRAGTYLEVQGPFRYGWPVNNLQEYVKGRAYAPRR